MLLYSFLSAAPSLPSAAVCICCCPGSFLVRLSGSHWLLPGSILNQAYQERHRKKKCLITTSIINLNSLRLGATFWNKCLTYFLTDAFPTFFKKLFYIIKSWICSWLTLFYPVQSTFAGGVVLTGRSFFASFLHLHRSLNKHPIIQPFI